MPIDDDAPPGAANAAADAGSRRRRRRRRLVTGATGVAIVVALAGGAAFAARRTNPTGEGAPTTTRPAEATAAAPSGGTCRQAPSQGNCDGKDPQEQGCEDGARTAALGRGAINGQEFVVELRASNACRTSWARARPADGKAATFGVLVEPSRGDGTKFLARPRPTSHDVSSPMAFGATAAVRACVLFDGRFACTAGR